MHVVIVSIYQPITSKPLVVIVSILSTNRLKASGCHSVDFINQSPESLWLS